MVKFNLTTRCRISTGVDHIAGVRGAGGILCNVVCNLRLDDTGRILNENGIRNTYVHGIVSYVSYLHLCLAHSRVLKYSQQYLALP